MIEFLFLVFIGAPLAIGVLLGLYYGIIAPLRTRL